MTAHAGEEHHPRAHPSGELTHTMLAASMVRFPLAPVHPVILTFITGGVLSYLSDETVRVGYLMAVGLVLAADHARRGAEHVRHPAQASPACTHSPITPVGLRAAAPAARNKTCGAISLRRYYPDQVMGVALQPLSFLEFLAWPSIRLLRSPRRLPAESLRITLRHRAKGPVPTGRRSRLTRGCPQSFPQPVSVI
jgi:hypothetical protein